MVAIEWKTDKYKIHHSEIVENAYPEQVKALLMSQQGAAHFRDIKEYTVHRKTRFGEIYCEYAAGWKFLRHTVRLCIQEKPRDPKDDTDHIQLRFRTPEYIRSGLMRVQGQWTLTHIPPHSTSVALIQEVQPLSLPAWIPLSGILSSRIHRVFEDIRNAVGGTRLEGSAGEK